MPDHRVDPKHRENFIIEMDKACIAMGDALLLLNKGYHYLYQKRAKKITEISFSSIPSGSEIQKLYLEAVNRKLYPCFKWTGDKEMIQRWFMVRDLFGTFFLWFESLRLKKKFVEWETYSSHIAKKTMTIMACPNKLNFIAIMPPLLFSLKENQIDKELLMRAQKLLGLKNQRQEPADWITAVRGYLRVFHPGGVIAELIKEADR